MITRQTWILQELFWTNDLTFLCFIQQIFLKHKGQVFSANYCHFLTSNKQFHNSWLISSQEFRSTWSFIENTGEDFPGGPVVKNLPANAGSMGSVPVWEDFICHGSSSPCATTTEPTRLESMLCNKKSHCTRAPCTTKKGSPRWLQLEKAQAQQQRLSTAKNKLLKN